MDTLNQLKSEGLEQIITQLEQGKVRVAEQQNGTWVVNTDIKQAILDSFRHRTTNVIPGSYTNYYDKFGCLFADPESHIALKANNSRILPGAVIREGSYIGKNTIIMPSFINIGAYVGEHTMIDTWATVGSCAQIGANVHISGGAGIGGVLEPLQASPTIIEDHCFIGARSEVVEGVIVRTGAVLAMGTFISQSTKIYDRTTDTVSYGEIPEDAVVVPGTLPSSDGKYNLNAAIIVKYVDAKTKEKVGINNILREYN